jgi:lipopolysaccharide transport system permease protein
MTSTAVDRNEQVLVLRGEKTRIRDLLRDTWRQRELVATLARKDFFVQFRRASLGVLWAIALPAFQAAILSIVFSHIIRVRTGVSYPVFVLSGLMVLTFFTSTVTTGSTAVVDGLDLSSKIYFPRLVLPLVKVVAGAYNLLISVVILLIASVVFGVGIGIRVLWLVPAIFLVLWLAAGACAFLSGLHVYFRDVRYIVLALFSAALYVTPVIYPVRQAPHALRVLLEINPLTGVVELVRRGTAGADPHIAGAILGTVAWSILLTIATLVLYARRDRVFVDLM